MATNFLDKRRFALGLFLVLLWGRQLSAQIAEIQNPDWKLSIQPQTLQVTAVTHAGQRLTISSALSHLGSVEQLHVGTDTVRWALPAQHLLVEMKLEEHSLNVQFVASDSGSFTWPIMSPTPGPQAYILPLFEGVYVPTNDKAFADFLVGQGPIDTTGGLSMPFWGLDWGGCSVTYIATNIFNNELNFSQQQETLTAQFTHHFTTNVKHKEYGFRISLTGPSPVAPATTYRNYLKQQKQFVTLQEKIARNPSAARLLGAAHVYLWGEGLITRNDFADCKTLCAQIVKASKQSAASVGKHLWTLSEPDDRTLMEGLAVKDAMDNYDKGQLADALSRVLHKNDFYDAASWSNIKLPTEVEGYLKSDRALLSASQLYRLNSLLLASAYWDMLKPVDSWGDGLSPKMLKLLSSAGLDRLWLGSPDWDGLRNHPDLVQSAESLGYLIGPYDSFHSIHSPDQSNTWETAQFDQNLYDTGAVIKADGSKKKGFLQKGYILSPLVARPYVEKRVSQLMSQFRCNSWFVDCDATGEVFDDYSPAHPATQEDDMNARLSRLAWIRDTYHTVIGSEGGSAYAAGTIDFAHGIMTPVIGWGDPDLTNRASHYYLGGYYPPDGPALFFKQVLMKAMYRHIYADPRFRLPLYETVFHDSVVATHQWGYASLKFVDEDHARELLELLYNVPPLYHLNLAEWSLRKEQIKAHFDFFSPLHRSTALLPMTQFNWLTPDHLVQQTLFGNSLEMIANFSSHAFTVDQMELPARTIRAKCIGTGQVTLFTPAVLH